MAVGFNCIYVGGAESQRDTDKDAKINLVQILYLCINLNVFISTQALFFLGLNSTMH